MNIILPSSLKRACALVALSTVFLLATECTQAAGPDIQAVLQRHYQAIGGIDKARTIQAYSISGRFVSADGGWKKHSTILVHGSKIRLEMDIQAGMKMIQACDGSSGWNIMPWSGSLDPQPMNVENVKALSSRTDIFTNDLVVYEERGTKLTMLPSEEIDGSDCFKIVATRTDGITREYYLDADSYLIVKIVTKYSVNQQDAESEVYYSNYRTVDGMLLPFAIENKGGGGMYIDHYTLNATIPDTDFTMPSKGK